MIQRHLGKCVKLNGVQYKELKMDRNQKVICLVNFLWQMPALQKISTFSGLYAPDLAVELHH